MKKTIVIGLGNPILRDDGVGIHVVRAVKRKINSPNIIIEEASTGGMNLVDLITGYDNAIIIDAISTENGNIGDVKILSIDDLDMNRASNYHDMGFKESLQLAKKIGYSHIPKNITIIGITIKERYTFGEQLTEDVAKSIPKTVDLVISELKKYDERSG